MKGLIMSENEHEILVGFIFFPATKRKRAKKTLDQPQMDQKQS